MINNDATYKESLPP